VKSYLKKIISGVVAMVTLFSLFGCSSNQLNEQKIAMDMEIILTQLFDSVKNGEKEIFKTFFADFVLNDSDFEEGCDYVFALYQGDLLEIDCNLPLVTGTLFVPGERIHSAETSFHIITSVNEYVLFIGFYTQYSKYPEGSYKIKTFKLITKQMYDGGEDFTDCSLRNGIYYPNWPLPELN